MIFAAPVSTATQSTSASTSRPSASVLCTSIVLPLRAVSTSPSLYAAGPVMFSTRPIRPTTFTGNLSRAIGLHRPEHGRGAGHVALHRQHRVGRLERQAAGIERHSLADQRQAAASLRRRPCNEESPAAARGPNRGRRPTANRTARAPAAACPKFRPSTRTPWPLLRPCSANEAGYSSCGGSFTSRRVRLTLSPRIWPRSIAAASPPDQSISLRRRPFLLGLIEVLALAADDRAGDGRLVSDGEAPVVEEKSDLALAACRQVTSRPRTAARKAVPAS